MGIDVRSGLTSSFNGLPRPVASSPEYGMSYWSPWNSSASRRNAARTISTYSRVLVIGFPHGCPCQPSTTCGPDVPSPRRKRPPDMRSRVDAVIAVFAGVRAVITAQSVGHVVESNDRRFSVGDLAVGQLGWQEYATARAGTLRPVPGELDPQTLALHAVGMTGLTAYFGLFDVGKPRAGDTVVVSCAAGAVGQIAGQLAKIAGCRAVGIAGGPEKARDLIELYGYDAAIDYKNDGVAEALRGERVDVYFDNVGGEISQAVHSA